MKNDLAAAIAIGCVLLFALAVGSPLSIRSPNLSPRLRIFAPIACPRDKISQIAVDVW